MAWGFERFKGNNMSDHWNKGFGDLRSAIEAKNRAPSGEYALVLWKNDWRRYAEEIEPYIWRAGAALGVDVQQGYLLGRAVLALASGHGNIGERVGESATILELMDTSTFPRHMKARADDIRKAARRHHRSPQRPPTVTGPLQSGWADNVIYLSDEFRDALLVFGTPEQAEARVRGTGTTPIEWI